MNASYIDEALRQIAPLADGCADQIIDIREAASSAENPGRCVRCYFEIYGKAAAAIGDRLLPLRQWLERHIEVVARDESLKELERVPVVLGESEDLESFCRSIISEFRENRVYPHQRIDLTFRFRDQRAA